MTAVLDTHAVIWFLMDSSKLSTPAASVILGALERDQPTYISAITLIETTYLVERGRVATEAYPRLINGVIGPKPAFAVVATDLNVAEALRRVPRDIVPDMPDRIIAATALYLNLPLVTCDRRIQASGIPTIW